MGKLNTLDPATIKAFETYLGLNVDGQWDSDLERSVGRYQTMLGQTPGQTDTAEQYAALVEQLQKRAAAFGPGADTTPMQDTGFQAFLRESGARESELLDEIRYRTEQTTREINRRAAGFALEKEQATTSIRQNFAERGFGAAGPNTFQDRKIGEAVTDVDSQQMNFEASQRDALAAAARNSQSDINALYRRRVDEELDARNRLAKTNAEGTYRYVG